MARKKTTTLGALEVRMRFHQGRADAFKAKAHALELRIDKLRARAEVIRRKGWQHGEEAAGLRGHISRMRQKDYTHMTTERSNGISSATFFNPKHGKTYQEGN